MDPIDTSQITMFTKRIMEMAITITWSLVGGLAVLALLIIGARYIYASATQNDDLKESLKRHLKGVFVGIMIVAFAGGIVTIVLTALPKNTGIPDVETETNNMIAIKEMIKVIDLKQYSLVGLIS